MSGYNTSERPLQFDENSSPTFTHDLALSTVPIVTIGGVEYREFLLDINQTSNNPLLSLHELQVFVGNTGRTDRRDCRRRWDGELRRSATRIYDMDANAGGDSRVELDYNLNSGSGSGDMFFYLNNNLFAGGTFVTLYSAFGAPNTNNDGFEEWAVRTPTSGGSGNLPEPGLLSLFGAALALTSRRLHPSSSLVRLATLVRAGARDALMRWRQQPPPLFFVSASV